MNPLQAFENKAFVKHELQRLCQLGERKTDQQKAICDLEQQIATQLQVKQLKGQDFLFHFDDEISVDWWILISGTGSCYIHKSRGEIAAEQMLFVRRDEIDELIEEKYRSKANHNHKNILMADIQALEAKRETIQKQIQAISSSKYDYRFQRFRSKYYSHHNKVLDVQFSHNATPGEIFYPSSIKVKSTQNLTVFLEEDSIVGYLPRSQFEEILGTSKSYKQKLITKALSRLQLKHDCLIHLNEMKRKRPEIENIDILQKENIEDITIQDKAMKISGRMIGSQLSVKIDKKFDQFEKANENTSPRKKPGLDSSTARGDFEKSLLLEMSQVLREEASPVVVGCKSRELSPQKQRDVSPKQFFKFRTQESSPLLVRRQQTTIKGDKIELVGKNDQDIDNEGGKQEGEEKYDIKDNNNCSEMESKAIEVLDSIMKKFKGRGYSSLPTSRDSSPISYHGGTTHRESMNHRQFQQDESQQTYPKQLIFLTDCNTENVPKINNIIHNNELNSKTNNNTAKEDLQDNSNKCDILGNRSPSPAPTLAAFSYVNPQPLPYSMNATTSTYTICDERPYTSKSSSTQNVVLRQASKSNIPSNNSCSFSSLIKHNHFYQNPSTSISDIIKIISNLKIKRQENQTQSEQKNIQKLPTQNLATSPTIPMSQTNKPKQHQAFISVSVIPLFETDQMVEPPTRPPTSNFLRTNGSTKEGFKYSFKSVSSVENKTQNSVNDKLIIKNKYHIRPSSSQINLFEKNDSKNSQSHSNLQKQTSTISTVVSSKTYLNNGKTNEDERICRKNSPVSFPRRMTEHVEQKQEKTLLSSRSSWCFLPAQSSKQQSTLRQQLFGRKPSQDIHIFSGNTKDNTQESPALAQTSTQNRLRKVVVRSSQYDQAIQKIPVKNLKLNLDKVIRPQSVRNPINSRETQTGSSTARLASPFSRASSAHPKSLRRSARCQTSEDFSCSHNL